MLSEDSKQPLCTLLLRFGLDGHTGEDSKTLKLLDCVAIAHEPQREHAVGKSYSAGGSKVVCMAVDPLKICL